jgi:hypothetical protein
VPFAGVSTAALLLVVAPATAAQFAIAIDGELDDWDGVAVAYTDASGDGSGADFGRLWIADDDRFLFLRLEVGQELDLSENNSLRIYLDTDDNAATGTPVAGIGAELEWRFGDRQGTFVTGGSTTVFHEDIRFRAGPTVTATAFEMAFGRDTRPDGQNLLFPGPVVRVVVRDQAGGDQLPGSGDLVTYTMDQGSLPPELPIALQRQQSDDLRLVTFNVLSDSPWDGGETPRFERLVAAADPDIICFQEIYDHSAAQTAALVGSWLPGPWSAAANTDCKTVTRRPILASWAVGNELATLIDAQATLGADLLVINAHLPCCSEDAARQDAVDEIMAFVRDARTPGGADEGAHGPDFTPDWDGTDLLDVIARQTEKRMSYTWRRDTSSFWPGRLDFIIATDSVVDVGNRFILYTPEMSSGELAANGLLAGDSLASDHLLLAADLRAPSPPCAGDINGDGAVDVQDFLGLLAAWGDPGGAADLNGDGMVDVQDFLDLLAFWGAC